MLRARLGSVEVGEGFPVRVMGAINVSMESFYKGSVAPDVGSALALASRMLDEGADILDVGGMSTAPYVDSRSIPPDMEASRVLPVVRALRRELGSRVTISVDTVRASVASAALAAGADVVNDVSGCRADPAMASAIASAGASAVLGAREDETPSAGGPLATVRSGLRSSMNACASAGVDLGRIAVDPGIGFFRGSGIPWHEWDLEVLADLERLLVLLRPICVGVSRKSFIGRALGLERPEERLAGTIAAEAIAVANGAHVIRAHDVREAVHASRIGEAIRAKRASGVRSASSPPLEVLDLSAAMRPGDLDELSAAIGAVERAPPEPPTPTVLVLDGLSEGLALRLRDLASTLGGALLKGQGPALLLLPPGSCAALSRGLLTPSAPGSSELAGLLEELC